MGARVIHEEVADLPPDDPNSGNRMSITPSVSSASLVSAATSTMQYSMAARALLKHTSHYTEDGLVEFVEEKYPEIPSEQRHSLVVGAVTGAQTAAQLFVLMEGSKSGRDRGSRDTTEGARRTLSLYNLGLMSEDPHDPNPQIKVSPRLSSTQRRQTPILMETPEEEERPKGPEAPVLVEETQSSEDEREKNTETPARAIELVELEIPGTQPCNRRGEIEKEGTSSTSTTVDAYKAALAREHSFYLSVNERIRQQIEMETLEEEARAKLREASGPNSQEIPPSPPLQKERRVELPLLLRLPPPPSNTTTRLCRTYQPQWHRQPLPRRARCSRRHPESRVSYLQGSYTLVPRSGPPPVVRWHPSRPVKHRRGPPCRRRLHHVARHPSTVRNRAVAHRRVSCHRRAGPHDVAGAHHREAVAGPPALAVPLTASEPRSVENMSVLTAVSLRRNCRSSTTVDLCLAHTHAQEQ